MKMFEIAPWIEGLATIIFMMYIFIRWKLAPLVEQFVRRYGEEIKRTIQEKTNQLNLTAGRF